MAKCNFDYSAWCNRQVEEIAATMREASRRGTLADAAFFLIPCTDTEEGRLVLADDYPPGMPPVIRLGDHRTWRTIPYSHLASLIHRACGSEPIIPPSAWEDQKRA
jgi:hypothetical protein